jgi:hypothetical protein
MEDDNSNQPKYSIHSTSLQDILLTNCTTETKKKPIEPQTSTSSSTSRRVAIPLTHEHHTEQQQGQAMRCYAQNIALQASRLPAAAAAAVGGSFGWADGHGVVETIVVVVVMVPI